MNKKFKVKTITCHEVYNHGATLQELALLDYLDELGFDAETISYKPDYLTKPHQIFSCENPNWNKHIITKLIYIVLKAPQKIRNIKRRKNFDIFSKKHIKSTALIYKSNEALKENIPKATAYICGSDQIWNSLHNNGKDPAFYLDFAPEESIKISYAASFATEQISEDIKAFVRKKVSYLNKISVRETSAVKILNDIGIQKVTHVCDPVFLRSRDFWISLCAPNIINEKYIFIYDFDNNILLKKTALNFKKKYGFKIITINKNIKYSDQNYWNFGPDYFLTLIKNASFILTNSFHAVAFSIIFEKNFYLFNRNEKINTRMRDLVNYLGLSERLINDQKNKISLENIDYNPAQKELNKLILISKNFLSESLKSNSK